MVDGSKNKLSSLAVLEKTYLALLLIIFGGIVLHAPLSVGFGVLFPDVSLLIKSWKEILMVIAAVVMVVLLRRTHQLSILKEPLLAGIAAYAGLHVFLVGVFGGQLQAIVAGLLIDLRYLAYFGLVYVAIRLYPQYRRAFTKVGIAGALVVLIFGLLQVFVLPIDILKYIGYSTQTIVPYLTVDQNYDFIRISSTLRGPNPLGAYAVIVLAIVAAFIVLDRVKKTTRQKLVLALLAIGGVIVVWASYSRSALGAAVVALVIVLLATRIKALPRRVWVIGGLVTVALVAGLALARDSDVVSNVILHEDPGQGSQTKSNDGHVESLQDGVARMAMQPLGGGIGSTGSASLLGDNGLIIENQYLFIAHEAGWVGLVMFVFLFAEVMRRLWRARQDYLALGVFASGVGLALIGLLLPVWADDTVALIWWGLAAVVIASPQRVGLVKKEHHGK